VLFEASNYCNGLSEHLYNARPALSNSIYTPLEVNYQSTKGILAVRDVLLRVL
jgi:hypothetical protein